MWLLVVGMVVFFGVHLVPSSPVLRDALVARLGEAGYKGLFSVLSLLGFALLVVGTARAESMPIWQPPAWGRYAALALMPFAFISLAAAYLPSNVKRWTRHPMLWGVVIWAAAHLSANGDLASALLFGSFGVYALFGMASANRRGAQLAARRRARGWDVALVTVGLAAYGTVLVLHAQLFGAAVI
ncbi:MAG TPA: NnrU family protein [Acidiferrobacterales bacterium]